MFVKRKVVLSGSLIFLTIVTALWIGMSPRYQVEILDNRFQLLSFKISPCEQGARHTFALYEGNQFMGKLLAPLHRIGIRIGDRGLRSSPVAWWDGWAFAIGYTKDFKGGKPPEVRFELIDETGKETPIWAFGGVESITWYNSKRIGKSTNLKILWLKLSSINQAVNYHLRITLPERNLEVAHIHLEKLRKWKR